MRKTTKEAGINDRAKTTQIETIVSVEALLRWETSHIKGMPLLVISYEMSKLGMAAVLMSEFDLF